MRNGKAPRTEIDRDFDLSVGRRIRDARLAAGLTQSDVARGAGVTFQQLQKYERGDNRVAASRLAAIARTLGVTAGALMGEGGAPPVDDGGPEPEVRTLVRRYRECGPRARLVLLRLAEDLASGSEP